MRIGELVSGLGGLRLEQEGEAEITGIAYHSKRVKDGDLFVAIPGFETDGHLYIEEAVQRGAAGIVAATGRALPDELPARVALIRTDDPRLAMALLSDRFWRHPSGKLKLVGVTGTNGKTTTAHLVEAASARAGLISGLIGTVVYRVAGRELPVGRTTPESSDLQEILAAMVEAGCETASMEVSSHALALRRVDGCDFEVAVFTNLSQDHLDFHADLQDYYGAKERLFLPRVQGGLEARSAAINIDDPYGRGLREKAAGRVLTFGTGEEADLRGELLEAGLKRSRVRLVYADSEWEGETALTGRFNLQNIMGALGACILLGMDPGSSLEGILSHPGVPGRFQAVDEGQDFAVLVDYAHTPDSLRRVLEAAREISEKKVIVAFGCGGDRDRGKRPMMGEIAAQTADVVFITSDNPRSEDPLAIIAEIEEGARSTGVASPYTVIADRREAIQEAINAARSGDIVVIAGKGHEKGQIFADRVIPFDDEEEARAALRRRVGCS
jgi:UDP-N-acetylmuramoyl-L-alanyl-D-glutamate--2,6-diaminopimelate ligase